jgi:hypothetical protein
MKWIVKLVAEPTPGHAVEQEIATLEREELVSPESVGLSIAEGKQILESLQKQMVAMQVQHHNASLKSCFRCGKSFRTKGYHQSRALLQLGLSHLREYRDEETWLEAQSAVREAVVC